MGPERVPVETFVQRLCSAVNAHDLEAVVDCFADDYINETPAHPARGFRGRTQVRRNWSRILEGVPDLEATVLAADEVGSRVWSEWEMRGTRVDGQQHLVRGVMVFTVAAGLAASVRFYLEPVDHSAADADQAVHQLMTGTRP